MSRWAIILQRYTSHWAYLSCMYSSMKFVTHATTVVYHNISDDMLVYLVEPPGTFPSGLSVRTLGYGTHANMRLPVCQVNTWTSSFSLAGVLYNVCSSCCCSLQVVGMTHGSENSVKGLTSPNHGKYYEAAWLSRRCPGLIL